MKTCGECPDFEALAAECARLKTLNVALMGNDENLPRYTTKRLRQEIATATERLDRELAETHAKAEKLAAMSKSMLKVADIMNSEMKRRLESYPYFLQRSIEIADEARAALTEWENRNG